MIRYLLIAVNLVLLAALAVFWLDSQGRPRGVTWQAPVAKQPELPVVPSNVPERDASAFLQALDRPLFSPSRRPVPASSVVTQAASVVDPLAGLQLLGVYGGGAGGGVIAMIDGKVQRKSVGQQVGAWELRSVAGREATFASAGETRTVRIARVLVPADKTAAPVQNSAPSVSIAPDASVEDSRRDRIRRLNALRAKGGMPPLVD